MLDHLNTNLSEIDNDYRYSVKKIKGLYKLYRTELKTGKTEEASRKDLDIENIKDLIRAVARVELT